MSQVCAAIEKQAVETPVSTIAISWFGGEPLLNLPVIVQGMSRLSAFCGAHQIALHAGMTTNGYGLTPDVFSKLMELGVTGFQITLDGMAETHDRNRVLRSGGGTWQTIWNHLLYMNSTKHDFRVSLRMNASPENQASVRQLIQYKNAHLDSRFQIQIQPIVRMGGMGDAGARYCSSMEATEVQLSLYRLLGSQRDPAFSRISHILRPFGMICNSDDPTYLVIKTDGSLCKCELLIEDEQNQVGSAITPGLQLDRERLLKYSTPSFSETCTECVLFPMCFGLNCPYQRLNGYACTLRETFDLHRYIQLLAEGLRNAKGAS